MDNKIPVLEWRAADAAQKLIKAADDLALSMPDGDNLDANGRKIWIYSTAAGALCTTNIDPNDEAEMLLRAKGMIYAAFAVGDGLSLEGQKALAVFMLQQGVSLNKSL